MDYVVGFAFCGDRVALIEKNRPEWQKGKLNGIGGKIEQQDVNHQWAMAREFWEETGYRTWGAHWRHIAILQGTNYAVQVFTIELTPQEFSTLISATDEPVVLYQRDCIPWDKAVPNLRWLIPLCRCEGNIQYPVVVPYGPDEAKK